MLSERFLFSQDTINQLQLVYGKDTPEVIKKLKLPSSHYCIRVNTLKADPEEVVKELREKGVNANRHPNLREIIFLPVEGPLPIPNLSSKVVVYKQTAEAVLLGAHVYAPGIKKCTGLRKDTEVLITDIYDQAVGAGITRMTETEILTQRSGLAIEVTHPKYLAPSIRESSEFKEGIIYSQSFPAIITSRVLDPQPEDTVVDLTCAPGGKISHLSQLMENRGIIIGVDRNQSKIAATKETLTRLWCKNIKLLQSDSRYLDLDYPSIKADKCLVDPPCSALGVMPKLYDGTKNAEIQALSEYQRQFIKVASKIVRVGGIIVYSVCTVTIAECENLVKFAVENCDVEVDEQPIFYGSPGLDRIFLEARFTQRFHPHIHKAGYFIARFKKVG
ncbi:MAG: PUA domain-containing protein [Candidatus Bathyarchaeota archaeon]